MLTAKVTVDQSEEPGPSEAEPVLHVTVEADTESYFASSDGDEPSLPPGAPR